jgi:hypothetical protein
MSTAFDLGLVAACAFIGAIGAMLVGFRLVALWLFGLGAAVAFAGAAMAIGRGRHRRRP